MPQMSMPMHSQIYPGKFPLVVPKNAKNNGQIIFASVLFADIKGIKAFCHSVDLITSFKVLSAFHRLMARVVAKYSPFVCSTAGYTVMAAWSGKPEAAALDALQCGLEMRRTARQWNRNDLHARYNLGVGIGLHCGPTILARQTGDANARKSVFGNTVNTAKCLEQMTRNCSAELIASEQLLHLASSYADANTTPYGFGSPEKIDVSGTIDTLSIRVIPATGKVPL